MEGFFVGGIAAAAVALVPALLILAVLVIVGGRGEPDPTGRRNHALYLATITFVALFIALFAGFGTVTSVAQVPVNDEASGPAFDSRNQITIGATRVPSTRLQTFRSQDPDDAAWRSAVQAGLIALAALAVLAFHVRRVTLLRAEPGFEGSPAWRVYNAYLYAVCFFAAVIVLFATAVAVYGIFQAIAPGVATGGSHEHARSRGVTQVVSAGVLAAAAGGIFLVHWQHAHRRAKPPPTAPASTTPPLAQG